jgi:hypothetical protein
MKTCSTNFKTDDGAVGCIERRLHKRAEIDKITFSPELLVSRLGWNKLTIFETETLHSVVGSFTLDGWRRRPEQTILTNNDASAGEQHEKP